MEPEAEETSDPKKTDEKVADDAKEISDEEVAESA